MNKILALLAIPLSGASAWISGTVVDLSGNPVQGVVVVSSIERDVSTPQGSWVLGRSLSSQGRESDRTKLSTNLSIRNARISLAWGGHSVDGRRIQARLPASVNMGAGRSARKGAGDTLQVYYHGKRLVFLPLESSDTDGVLIQIDTAWDDDHGIPWNARVQYGSLRDERDGRVYRTIGIGSLDWMGENLAYSGPMLHPGARIGYDSVGICNGFVDSNCTRYGRLYSWKEAVGNNSDNPAYTLIPVPGVCPSGWRVPDDADWLDFLQSVGHDTADFSLNYKNNCSEGLCSLGRSLFGNPLVPARSWASSLAGTDRFGFRALSGGRGHFLGSSVRNLTLPPQAPWSTLSAKTEGLGAAVAFWSGNNPYASGPGITDNGYTVVIGHVDEDSTGDSTVIFPSGEVYSFASLRCVKER